jgi:hypothetical protein
MWSTWQQTSDPTRFRLAELQWWDFTFDGRIFFAVSFAILLIWVIVACYRLMRLELQLQNWPIVWTGFVVFASFYFAGFANAPTWVIEAAKDQWAGIRLFSALLALAVLTYAAILHEPKDQVLYRWLAEMSAKRNWGAVLSRMQCWMIAYAATLVVGAAEIVELLLQPQTSLLLDVVLAGLGFLTRDIGIVLFFALTPGQKRGDMPAILTIVLLYTLGPQLFSGLGSDALLLFVPAPGNGMLGAAIAWAEAAAVWIPLVMRSSNGLFLAQPVRK